MKTGPKVGLILAAILLPCCGGLVAIGAFVDDPNTTQRTGDSKPAAADQRATTSAPAAPVGSTPTVVMSPTTATPSASATDQPIVEKRTVTETQEVAFKTRTVKDSSLAEGSTGIRTEGVAGINTLTYEVTITDGVQTAKKLLRSKVTKQPVTKVVAVGTKAKRQCDSNYGGCVPIASDVDCAGGSGNGPAYVSGPVKVIGADIYDLDRDGDGYGCDD